MKLLKLSRLEDENNLLKKIKQSKLQKIKELNNQSKS